jgi:PleD family two-component response regulator
MECPVNPDLSDVAFSGAASVTPESQPIPQRILIVEDEESARDGLQHLLQENLRIEVDAAADGA